MSSQPNNRLSTGSMRLIKESSLLRKPPNMAALHSGPISFLSLQKKKGGKGEFYRPGCSVSVHEACVVCHGENTEL